MIEREVRYKINNDIKDKIISSSESVERPNICVDLCMGKYSFDSLDKLGYIIRLRNKNNKCVLESKRLLDDNSWHEAVICLNTMREGYDFLKNIGLKPYLYINRTRETRKIKQAKIFIDEVDMLGTFVEFELEEGFEFEDLKPYLKENDIDDNPAKLYGDIFKENLKDNSFKTQFNNVLNEFLKNN